jgi:hypothetical protein
MHCLIKVYAILTPPNRYVYVNKNEEETIMWAQDKQDGFDYCLKYYDVGSIYGINEGRVSKMEIRKGGKLLANYDRGWEPGLEPTSSEVVTVMEKLLEKYK